MSDITEISKEEEKAEQKEEEIREQMKQIHLIEVSRDALLEEVTFLSARNAQVEEQIQSLPSLQNEIKAAVVLCLISNVKVGFVDVAKVAH